MRARPSFGHRLAILAGTVMLVGGIVAMAVPASAKGSPTPLCTGTISSGNCLLYTPGGTNPGGASVDFVDNASLGQLTLTFHNIAAPTDGPWICIGPSPMAYALFTNASVCTSAGCIPVSPNDVRSVSATAASPIRPSRIEATVTPS